MNLRRINILIVLVALTVPLFGHHAGYFDQNKVVELSGTVTRFEWTNPHSFLYLDIQKPDGVIEHWTIEGRSPNQLRRSGWSAGPIVPGETVIVVGRPPRDASRLAGSLAKFLGAGSIELPSGQKLAFGPALQND